MVQAVMKSKKGGRVWQGVTGKMMTWLYRYTVLKVSFMEV